MDAEARFAELAQAFPADVVEEGGRSRRRFGSDALKVDGRIFAMLVGGELVVKLPRARVEELVAAATGSRFELSRGRPAKEWLALAPGTEGNWLALATEARSFVGGAPAAQ